MIYKTTSELKRMARGRMLNNYGVAVSALVLLELIFFLISNICTSVVDMNSVSGTVIYFAITFIVNLIATVLVVGELSIYLKLACGKKASVADMFSMFKQHPDKIIVVQLLIFVRILIAALPAIITGAFYYLAEEENDIAFIAFIAGLIISAIACIYVRVITSQSFYLLLDFPQYSASELINYSREIMKGHGWQLIVTVISFIPMMILGILSAGIGMLFVYPYYQMTLTEFYLDIIREPKEETVTFSAMV